MLSLYRWFLSQPRRDRLSLIGLVLIPLSAWISFRGIVHDSQLYLGQALLHVPGYEQIRNDLFFKYGSQDDFSLFSRVYAQLISWWGIYPAILFVFVLSKLAFLAGSYHLLKNFLDKSHAALATLGMFLLSRAYGGDNFHIIPLNVSEPFVTARSIAEPLCLFGISYLLQHRLLPSLACFLFALSMHPLMTLPAIAACGLYLLHQRISWTGLALALPVAAGASLYLLAHYPATATAYDQTWWQIVSTRNQLALPSHWGLRPWSILITDLLVLWMFLREAPRHRYFLVALGVVAVSAMLVCLLDDLALRNVLLTSAQIWRAGWLLHLLASGLLIHLLIQAWRADGPINTQKMALLILCLLTFSNLQWIYALISALLRPARLAEKTSLPALALTAIPLSLIIPVDIHWYLQDAIAKGLPSEPARYYVAVNFIPGYLSGCLAVYALWRYTYLRLLPFIGALTVLTLIYWVAPSPSNISSDLARHTNIIAKMPKNTGLEIYWPQEISVPWLSYKTAGFFSHPHGAGVLFNRQTAMDYAQRQQALGTDTARCLDSSTSSSCPLSAAALTRICTQYKTLDLVFLTQAIPTVPPAGTVALNNQFYDYYRCSLIRK